VIITDVHVASTLGYSPMNHTFLTFAWRTNTTLRTFRTHQVVTGITTTLRTFPLP